MACLHSRTSRHPHCLHLLRALAFIEAHHGFHLQPLYINTKLNHLADDLSRNNLPSFLTKVPLADRHPAHLPPYFSPSSWIQSWTGPHHAGSISSAIFSGRSRPIDKKVLQFGNEEVPFLLQAVPSPRPIPSDRTPTLLFFSIYGRRGPVTPDNQVIPSSH